LPAVPVAEPVQPVLRLFVTVPLVPVPPPLVPELVPLVPVEEVVHPLLVVTNP
jgi:hypothetical protein